MTQVKEKKTKLQHAAMEPIKREEDVMTERLKRMRAIAL